MRITEQTADRLSLVESQPEGRVRIVLLCAVVASLIIIALYLITAHPITHETIRKCSLTLLAFWAFIALFFAVVALGHINPAHFEFDRSTGLISVKRHGRPDMSTSFSELNDIRVHRETIRNNTWYRIVFVRRSGEEEVPSHRWQSGAEMADAIEQALTDLLKKS